MNDLTAQLLGMGQDEVREHFIKLPFAYPGAKGEQLTKILPHIPYGTGYGEGFGGSGAVLLNRNPSKLEIFNDRYAGITAFFRVVRDEKLFPLFMDRISSTLHSREEFIWCKKTWKNCEDDVERAARWYYMIRFAVNGKPNSTFGRSKNPIVRFADRLHKSLPLFHPLHRRLHTVTIENLDWRVCLDDFDQTGFVWYLDPTYLDSTPGTYEEELSISDHKELAARIPYLKGFVALSSYDGPITRSIYDKAGLWDEVITWDRTSTALTQAFTESNSLINHDGDRARVKEILWLRNFT
jgi:DNA adenine methylase